MNAITLLETYKRHKLTLEDVLTMMDKSILDPSSKYELIDGVVFQMPAEGLPHRYLKSALIAHLNRTLPDTYFVMADTTLELSASNAPSPDAYIIPAALAETVPEPSDVLLVIEVADTTLSDDLGPKAALYAEYGVQEYWVVDIERRVTLVHRERQGAAWAPPQEVSADDTAVCTAIPGLRLRLRDLKRVR